MVGRHGGVVCRTVSLPSHHIPEGGFETDVAYIIFDKDMLLVPLRPSSKSVSERGSCSMDSFALSQWRRDRLHKVSRWMKTIFPVCFVGSIVLCGLLQPPYKVLAFGVVICYTISEVEHSAAEWKRGDLCRNM